MSDPMPTHAQSHSPLSRRRHAFRTRKPRTEKYDRLLLQSHNAEWYWIASTVFVTKLTLFGYLILPGALAQVQQPQTLKDIVRDNAISHSIPHVSVLWLAGWMCAVGALCIIMLVWSRKKQHVFVQDRDCSAANRVDTS
jgi:hypothetical protein